MSRSYHISLILTLASVVKFGSSAATSRLQVHVPQSLSKPDGYDHRDALFGIPPYGGSIAQNVFYADSTLCDATVDKTKGFPERKDGNGKSLPWESPFILMVDRGDCTFVQKVRNAQRSGAAGVLIADSTCLCSDAECLEITGLESCEAMEPIMADDGSGSDISIPSFLMFKHDADAIKDVLKQNKVVRIEMKFSVPAPDSRVEYELWTTPKDVVSREFQRSFKEAAVALGKDASFTPHFYVYDGRSAGCQGIDGEDECANLCTNSGKYCTNDPDENLISGASGADVVAESLRRLCIWEIYGQDGIGKEFWDYSQYFMDGCDDPSAASSLFNDADCITKSMAQAKVDSSKVDKCMADSGGLEGNVNNTIFDEQLASKETAGVFVVPSLFINQAPVRGALTFSTAFKAICAGYASGYEPKVCQLCSACHDEEQCVRDMACESSGLVAESGGISMVTFLASMMALSFAFFVVSYIGYVRQQRHVQEQVRGIVAQYMPIDVNSRRPNDTSVGIEEDDENGAQFTID